MSLNGSQLISEDYLSQQQRLHRDKPAYGVSGQRYVSSVASIADRFKCGDILDYGCGKGTLQSSLPYVKIAEYDPAIPGKNELPEPADLVVCTDVLEHIEPGLLPNVLEHLRSLTRKCFFFAIDCGPANKHFPDGRNVHLIQEPPLWWLNKLDGYLHIGGFNERVLKVKDKKVPDGAPELKGFDCWGYPHV